VLLGKVVAFVMLPLYTRYLTDSDYGVIQLIDMTLEVIAIVAGSRLAAGVFHLYHKSADEATRRAVLGSAFVVVFLAFLAAAAVSWIGAPLIARVVLGDVAYAGLVRIAAISLGLQSLLLIPLAEVQLTERSGLFVTANAVKLVIQVALNIILLVGLDMGPRGVLLSTLAANVAIGVPLAIRFLRRVGLQLSREAVRDIFRLGLPFIGVQLAKFVQTFGDRYFLRAAASTAAVGVYGLGYQFGFLLATIGFAPFITAWEPLRFEIARRPDRDAVFNRVFLFLNVVLISAAVGITLFVGDFLHVATTPPFFGAAAIVPIVLVAYVAQCWMGFHNFGLFAGERTDLITVTNWVGAALALVLYALLIPTWHAMGAAWATLASFVISEWLLYREAQRVYPIRYEWGRVTRLCVLAVLVCGVSLALPAMPVLVSISVHVLLYAIYLALVWIGGILPDEDRARVKAAGRSPRAVIAALTRG
jgi:O-antigen/teichoic acid export membrane protein